ncbi:MAG TPA: hypothetical protein VD814_00720 [Nocardioides sp.]|nr:hypothetical protein [Nocardioides sp.]
MTPAERYDFAFAASYRLPALVLGITPWTAFADLSPEQLAVRFGPWSLATPVDNIRSSTITGGFRWLKTAGPPHLSFTDRGVTFATNGSRAVCVTFDEPVRVLDPTGRLVRHPGATLTLARAEDFRERLGR